MLDRKKFAAIIIAGVLIVAGITVAITVALTAQGKNQQSTEPAPSSPSLPATPTAPEELELSTEEMTLLQGAGEAASSFNNNPEFTLKPADYVAAGFTETLAKKYKPIWAGLFAGRADQSGARIEAHIGGPVGGVSVLKQSLKVLDYSGSNPGTYTVRVAADVTWSPQSVTLAPGKDLNWRAATAGGEAGHATWILTYDQLSQRVLTVEQPAWQDLGAEPLFEAMGLPVPTKGANTAAQGTSS